MYSIEIEENAERFLKKIEKKGREIILKKIYSIRDNPFKYIKRLKGHRLWRIRIMKYRAELDIIIAKNKIIVVRIGYRKNIYN